MVNKWFKSEVQSSFMTLETAVEKRKSLPKVHVVAHLELSILSPEGVCPFVMELYFSQREQYL